MAQPTSVWGIDIGQVALKALKVSNVTGELRVEAFEVIEHEKILSEPDANRNELIRQSLEQFLARHNVAKSLVAISVSGQSGFTRFVKLPPVESKKIPDIVRYEAEQQIPFPISEVNWQWQPFPDPNSPDVEVGIFAMKRTDVMAVLSHLTACGLKVDIVQMAPLSLCNYMSYDKQLAEDGATLLVDVGADKTDLVVSDGPRIWTRTIQIGGNSFTDALVKAFKLSFSKAEKLKRTAATSKYARQIFQAMRPVFADLVQEVQRSIGYYTSLHRETRFRRLVGLGNGFRLPGLQKFLEQNLNVPVVRVDSYNRLSIDEGVNAPGFQENVLGLAVAYGLAIQALDVPRVNTNLLPTEISRKRMWNRKRPAFAAAGALLVGMAGLWTYSAFGDRQLLTSNPESFRKAGATVQELKRLQDEYRQWINQGNAEQDQVENYVRLLGYRDYWPSVLATLSQTLSTVGTDQKLLAEYSKANKVERTKVLDAIKEKPRGSRKLLYVMDMQSTYLADVDQPVEAATGAAPAADPLGGTPRPNKSAAAAKTDAKRGFQIRMTIRTPLDRSLLAQEIMVGLGNESRKILQNLPSVGLYKFEQFQEPKAYSQVVPAPAARSGAAPAATVSLTGTPSTPAAGGARTNVPQGPVYPDALFPNEDMGNDTVFYVSWIFTINGDGIVDLRKQDEKQALRE